MAPLRGDSAPDDSCSLSVLGGSIDSLVVTTTRVNWPYIKLNGLVAVPQSTDSEMVERFEISADGSRLSYSFTIADPATFTRPVRADNYTVWQWLPGAVVEPYECTLDE